MTEPTDAKTWTPDQLKFQAWLALPSAARQPKSQKDLARQLEYDPATLSDWKKIPGFHDAVYDLALAYVIGDLVPILHAMSKEARNGSLSHAQWIFEVAGKWTPTTRQQHGNVPGESFTVIVEPKPWQDALAPFMPPSEGDDSAGPA